MYWTPCILNSILKISTVRYLLQKITTASTFLRQSACTFEVQFRHLVISFTLFTWSLSINFPPPPYSRFHHCLPDYFRCCTKFRWMFAIVSCQLSACINTELFPSIIFKWKLILDHNVPNRTKYWRLRLSFLRYIFQNYI